MRSVACVLVLFALGSVAYGDYNDYGYRGYGSNYGSGSYGATRVDGYHRDNGTYVQPHYRSQRDGNTSNNWSTYPNTNPYTGQTGARRYNYNYGR